MEQAEQISSERPGLQEVSVAISESYQDQDIGRKRRDVYRVNFEDVTFKLLFYSPNEIPSPLPPATTTLIFGQKPRLRKDSDWKEFLSASARSSERVRIVQGRSDLERKVKRGDLKKDALLVVESGPLAILQATQLLLPGSDSLKEASRILTQEPKGELFREFIDSILAGKFIDSEGNLKSAPDYEGEILMLRSLLGDPKATSELSRRREILRKKDETRFGKQEIDLSYRSKHGLNLDDLIAVHATDYYPAVDRDGRLCIRSNFDGSGYTVPRSSIHFALNQLVVAHRKGANWDDKRYVILVPLRRLFELNGPPVSLRAEDTYFVMSPGEALALPDETIIIAPKKEVRPQKPARIIPSPSDITQLDLQKLAKEWNSLLWRLPDEYYPQWDQPIPQRFDSLKEYIASLQEYWREKLYPHSVLPIVLNWIVNRELSKNLLPIVRRLAVNKIIANLGYKVREVNPYYLSELDAKEYLSKEVVLPVFVQEVEELARHLGFSTARHPLSVEARCESAALGLKDRLTHDYRGTPEESTDNFNIIRKDLIAAFPELTPQIRRMHYLWGAY